MNLDIEQAKAERLRAERRWRQTKLSVHRDIFRLLSHKVKDLIDFAKKCLYNKQIEECSTSKKLFHVPNHLSGKGGNVLPNNIPVNELPQTLANFVIRSPRSGKVLTILCLLIPTIIHRVSR